MRRVLIIQRVLPHYRLPFFERLDAELERRDIRLCVAYGQEQPGTVPRTVATEARWARRIRNTYASLLGTEAVWQGVPSELLEADLVVIEHATRLLRNYALITQRRFGSRRLAFWGHGTNLQQSSAQPARDALRGWLMRQVDWWFAYTELSGQLVAASGFPASRTTVVNNTIDTGELLRARAACSQRELDELRSRLGITGRHVAVYCGGLYAHKRLPFLLDACIKVRAAVQDFEVVFVGDGPDAARVEAAARCHPWIHYVGPQFGAARVPYFLLANAMLMPGLVGLAIVDSFALCTPLVTTSMQGHSPEIAYLQAGRNGLMTVDDVESFAAGVVAVLTDAALNARLRSGCEESTSVLTLDAMAQRFARGVAECLDTCGRRAAEFAQTA